MKTSLICCLMLAFSISSFCQKKSLNIEGAWKLVQYQSINGNSVTNEFPGKSMKDVTKIWSGNHFMFVGQTKIDTTISDGYGLGTYKLEGNKYEENISILFYKPWEGTTVKMLLDIKNDTLIQTYPVDENGKMDKDGFWIEKYVKIKK